MTVLTMAVRAAVRIEKDKSKSWASEIQFFIPSQG